MTDPLFPYFRAEIEALREAIWKRPGLAANLALGPAGSGDPHVERLLEGVALIAARLNRRLDEAYAGIGNALLDALYPVLVRPVPARTIVELVMPTAGGGGSLCMLVPRGTEMLARALRDPPELAGLACRFRTTQAATVVPLVVLDARLGRGAGGDREADHRGADAHLMVHLECRKGSLAQIAGNLPGGTLRFHINAEPRVGRVLYQLVMQGQGALLEARDRPDSVQRFEIRAVGFDADEALLQDVPRSLDGYRLLLEYFAFPDKFLFFDIRGLGGAVATETREFRLVIPMRWREHQNIAEFLMSAVNKRTIRLGCVPVVNLFETPAEPIRLTHEAHSYPVIIDQRRPLGFEVYGVDSVTYVGTGGGLNRRTLPPLYLRAQAPSLGTAGETLAWAATRSTAEDGANETALTIVMRDVTGPLPTDGILVPRVTATNRNVAVHAVTRGSGDYTLAGGFAAVTVERLRPVAPPVRLGSGNARLWRLVSHLVANRLSLVDGGAEAFRGLLRVYAFADSHGASLANEVERQIDAIIGVRSRHTVRARGGVLRQGVVDGTEIDVVLDETAFAGGAYLFSAILDRFVAVFAAVNTFSQISTLSHERQEPIVQWGPRMGHRPLL